MKYNTATLEGPLLDLAVAMAEGYELVSDLSEIGFTAAGMRSRPALFRSVIGTLGVAGMGACDGPWSPSTDPRQGIPIIERERIEHDYNYAPGGWDDRGGVWRAMIRGPGRDFWEALGPTQLLASMRCRVAQVYGETVELPDEAAR
jgi:hypothetical protein